MFLLALINVGAKGVMFSITDEIGIPHTLNGITIAMATMIGMNLPDLLLHPIFGSWLDTHEPPVAYRMIFTALTAFLIVGLGSTILLIRKSRQNELAGDVPGDTKSVL